MRHLLTGYKLTSQDGMTSLSVRQYILGVLKAHGLNEKDVTKFQTGGPDGDLGSSKWTASVAIYEDVGDQRLTARRNLAEQGQDCRHH